MGYVKFNPNPLHNRVGDCVVRAIAAACNCTWEEAYTELCVQGFVMCDMPSSNAVWKSLLNRKGFVLQAIHNSCPECYTIKDFADEHEKGTFVLGTGEHAVTVIDGNYYDSWDSGQEVPIFYFHKEN